MYNSDPYIQMFSMCLHTQCNNIFSKILSDITIKTCLTKGRVFLRVDVKQFDLWTHGKENNDAVTSFNDERNLNANWR